MNPDEWNHDIAMELAGEESIQLNNELWNLLHFMRDFYAAHGIAPDVRHVVGYLSSAQHCSKKEAKKALFEAFPYGYVKQACKIAGMKRPRAWSTG